MPVVKSEIWQVSPMENNVNFISLNIDVYKKLFFMTLKFGYTQLLVVDLFVPIECSHLHLAAPALNGDIKMLR